jgi:hypothetical protein
MTTPKPRYNQAQAYTASVNEVKEHLNNAIISHIYHNVMNELTDALLGIAVDNALLTKTPYRSFIYRGKFYNLESTASESPVELMPTLHARMNDYLTEHKQVFGYEIPCIKGILKSMMMASDRISDYKQILPDQIHEVFLPYNLGEPKRIMQPAEIVRLQKRITPFISVMKARMLQNFIQGQP